MVQIKGEAGTIVEDLAEKTPEQNEPQEEIKQEA